MPKRTNETLNGSKRVRLENLEPGMPDPRLDESFSAEMLDQSHKESPYEEEPNHLEGVESQPQTSKTSSNQQTGGLRKDGPAPLIEAQIIREGHRIHRSLRTEKFYRLLDVKFNFTQFDGNLALFANELDDFYANLLEEVVENPKTKPDLYSDEDYYWVVIKSSTLTKNIFIKPKKVKEFDRQEFTNKALRITQSFDEFILKQMEINIFVCSTITGKGVSGRSSKKRAPEDVSETSKRKTSVITMKNTDKSCGFRALFVGMSYFEECIADEAGKIRDEKKLLWRRIIASTRNDSFQVEGTKKLIADANTFTHNDQCQRLSETGHCDGICKSSNAFNYDEPFGSKPYHFEVMNDYLLSKGFNFAIIDASNTPVDCYTGPKDTGEETTIFIEWQKKAKHYNFIKDMRAYRETAYFCRACYENHWQANHKCTHTCSICGGYPICEEGEKVTCDGCNLVFRSEQCYESHLQIRARDPYVCSSRKKCTECKCTYKADKKKPHVCGEYFCTNCHEMYKEAPHYCWLKPVDLQKLQKEDEKNKFIVSFDIESMIVTQRDTHEDIHKPNMLISETVCDVCWDYNTRSKSVQECSECGDGKHVFLGASCVNSFCDYLYKDLAVKAAKNKIEILVFAHNSKGYDGQFVLRDFFEQREFRDPPSIVLQGLKLLKLGVNNVNFIDSLSFFQQPLSALPKSFGFENVVVKGFFPHKMNTIENLNYFDTIPPKEMFEPEFMKESTRQEFDEWHNKYTGNYSLVMELRKYCANDVKILTMAVMEFRNRFSSVTDFDPTTRSFTLASVAMEHFRCQVLKEKEIGVTPINGYFNTRNKSVEASIWLDFIQRVNGIQIKREVKIGPYYVDGLYTYETSREIFEYFGCPWHGCEQCFPEDRSRVNEGFLKGKTYDTLRRDTNDKIKYFSDRGYKMTLIWGHEYKDLLRVDKELKAYHKIRKNYYDFVNENKNLNIRDAFFGGRTNNIYFNYVCDEGEKIKYKDVTSLYPSVLVKNPYPVGHPIILNEIETTDISNYFGFIKCEVLAPKDLFIPVLPYRNKNKKLMFPLCKLCADLQSEDCIHTDEERGFIGTWFSEELKLAVSKGYRVIQIFEVLDYQDKHEETFKPYIKSWLKLKTESSGWPNHCTTDESKKEFIRQFEQREGIQLDEENMVKNPGLRYISKLMLNSLWGKLGQRRNQSQSIIVSNFRDFYKLISDAKYDVKGILPVNDEKFLVEYKLSDDSYDRAGNTSIAIAAMVTAYARIKLYSIIDSIEASKEGRVLYFDTDSVIYVNKDGENWYNPPDGDFLGDMTDEVIKDYGPNSYIEKFASGGPKNYGYVIRTPEGPKFITKIKGINITSGIKDILDFERIFSFANNYREGNRSEEIKVPQLQFRTTKEHRVLTNKFEKKYRVVSEKRIVVSSGPYQTLPFGYKK